MKLFITLLIRSVALGGMVLISGPSQAFDLVGELKQLTGYIVVGDETIEEFEGCEWGQRIEFSSGGSVICREYGYQYAYYVSVVLLVRPISLEGRTLHDCKMAVEDTLYDVDCSSYVAQLIRFYRAIANSGKADLAEHARYWLRLLVAE